MLTDMILSKSLPICLWSHINAIWCNINQIVNTYFRQCFVHFLWSIWTPFIMANMYTDWGRVVCTILGWVISGGRFTIHHFTCSERFQREKWVSVQANRVPKKMGFILYLWPCMMKVKARISIHGDNVLNLLIIYKDSYWWVHSGRPSSRLRQCKFKVCLMLPTC